MRIYQRNDASVGFLLMENLENKQDVSSSRIRGRWLIKYWPEAEEFVYGKKYDVLIFQKVYQPKMAEAFDGIKILDICDPDWITNTSIRRIIESMDAVVVPTEMFRQFLSQVTDKPVVVIPDRQDLEFFASKKKLHRGTAREAVWHGYSHNSHVLKAALPALKRFGLELSIISNEMVSVVSKADINKGSAIVERWSRWNLETFCDEMIKSDICIMPGSLHVNDRFKSNNKTTTAKALGMPVATNAEDLKRLLDPKERIKDAEAGLEEVKKHYDIRDSVKEMKQLIENIRARRSRDERQAVRLNQDSETSREGKQMA